MVRLKTSLFCRRCILIARCHQDALKAELSVGMTHAGSLLAGSGWPGHRAVLSGTFPWPVSRELACTGSVCVAGTLQAPPRRAHVPPLIQRVYLHPEGLMRSDRATRGPSARAPLINAVPGGVLRGEA